MTWMIEVNSKQVQLFEKGTGPIDYNGQRWMSLSEFVRQQDEIFGPMIKVWRFHLAPEEYRKLSPHGGDEEWIAYVPTEYKQFHIPFIESGWIGSIGISGVSEHPIEGGAIYIGAHA